MKRKITLASAIAVASQTHAAFDPNNAVLFAYDVTDDDSYFVDLGVTSSDLLGGASVDLTDAGLAAFLANNANSQWSVIAGTTTAVAGPPGSAGIGYANNGVISTSTSGIAVADTNGTNVVQSDYWVAWLADIQAASGGASSFGVPGTDPVSADFARNSAFFENSLIVVDSLSYLWFSESDVSYGALLSDPNSISLVSTSALASLSATGQFTFNTCLSCEPPPLPEIPIPATAWLFISSFGVLIGGRKLAS